MKIVLAVDSRILKTHGIRVLDLLSKENGITREFTVILLLIYISLFVKVILEI